MSERPGTTARGADTKDRIIQAALDTVREEGFADTTARAIARHGGFNQALIFYHFGGTDEALLAALDQSTEQRLTKYREAMGIASSQDRVRIA